MRTDRILLGAVIVGLLVIYTAIVYSFFSAEPETRFIYLTLLGLPISSLILFAPRATLIALGVLVYSVDWLSEFWELIPREATWVIDMIIIIFVGRTILLIPSRSFKTSAAEILIWIALSFAILSSLANGQSTSTLLIGLRVGFKYLLLFVAAYHLQITRDWLKRFWKILFAIGLIQTPVVLFQWALLGWDSPDDLCGTFGRNQTPGIALFLLVLFVYLCCKIIEERKRHYSYAAIFIWMTIAPLIGEAKFYFLFLPILVVFLIRSEFRRRPGLAIGIILSGLVMIFAADYAIVELGFWQEGRNPLSYIRKLPEVFQAEMEGPKGERIERTYKFVYAIKLAADSPKTALLGNGPGSVTQSYVSSHHSRAADYYSKWGLNSSAPSIPWLLTEYGYSGTILFLLILYAIYRRGRPLRASSDLQMRIHGRMLEAMAFLYGAWLFYAAAWQSDSMNFIFWPVAGLLVRQSYVEESAQKSAETARRIEEARSPENRADPQPA